MKRKLSKQAQTRLIYVRYVLPPVLMLLSVAMAFIPSYKYIIGGKMNETLSFAGLLNNRFSAARQVIFATAEQDAANLLFSKTVFWILAVCALLWLAAFAAAVYSAIVALKYFMSRNESGAEQSRTMFITFFPSRAVLCAVEGLILPLVLFPYILPLLYKNIRSYSVSLVLAAPDAMIFTAVSLLAVYILSILCAPMERTLNADLFKKHKAFANKDESEDGDYAAEQASTASLSKRERAEQNERIRRLLEGDPSDEDEK